MVNIKINNIIEKVKVIFESDFSGHDYTHTERVYKNSLLIMEKIPCDNDIVMLASLLHDVDDPKIFKTTNNYNARNIMETEGINNDIIEKVISIINKISFNGTGKTVPNSIEGKIVQDADRLDAIGAIGIARAFAYGGSHSRIMYNPLIKPRVILNEDTYRNADGTTINHFYEKLLLLKDLMNTDIGKDIAEKRTKFMEKYLQEFIDEWNGKK